MDKKAYWRFAAMIATSTLVMLGLMYLNTYALDHVFWSETRAWMALLMGATMAIVMLAFMLGMYKNRRLNIAIFLGAGAVIGLSLWLVRSQATITGVDYMQAMIPHHSIAVLTSERAQIVDPRVRKLADEIIAAQRREIAEMKYLVRHVDQHGPDPRARTGPEVAPAVVPARVALRQAELARVDLAEMHSAEVGKVLGDSARCAFAYSRHANPVAAIGLPAPGTGASEGVLKIHGQLVRMRARVQPGQAGQPHTAVLRADGIRLRFDLPPARDAQPSGGGAPAPSEAVLRIGQDMEVGYGGFASCTGPVPSSR